MQFLEPHNAPFVKLEAGTTHSKFYHSEANGYLLLPVVPGIRAVALWIRRNTTYTGWYVVDWRNVGGSGFWNNGSNSAAAVVNGAITTAASYNTNLPVGNWVLAYMESTQWAKGGRLFTVAPYIDVAFISAYTRTWTDAERADPTGAFPSDSLAYRYDATSLNGLTVPDVSGNGRHAAFVGTAMTLGTE